MSPSNGMIRVRRSSPYRSTISPSSVAMIPRCRSGLAALERQRIIDEYAELQQRIVGLQAILASPERQRGIIATELGEIVERYGDERRTRIIPFEGDMSDEDLIAEEDVVVTITRSGYAKRTKTDLYRSLRPMGRATSGVIGMRFHTADELLAMEVVSAGTDVLVATDGGYAKRTKIEEYPVQGRGGKGVLTAKIVAKRGQLVGALIVKSEDELYAITSNGGVIRTTAREVRQAQRQTMGVRLIDLPVGVTVVAVARNAEAARYAVLSAMGVFDSINTAVRDLTDSGGPGATGGLQVIFSARRVLLWTALLGLANVVLLSALATLAAFLYNLCADMVGGVEVTLAEQD